MIAERTRDKIAAARRKGKWTGGPAPLGYDVIDRKLVVNAAEAELVRYIFELYLTKRSAVAVAHTLNAEGRPTKQQVTKAGKVRGLREWDKNAVLHVLRSPVVAGLMPYKGEVHQGEHEAILDRGTYEEVQVLLDGGSGDQKRWGRNPKYILTGLLFCARCGAAFTPASTRTGDREYRYYRCGTRDRMGRDACESRQLPAPAIEDFVIQRVREALADGTIAADVAKAASERIEHMRKALLKEREALPAQIAAMATGGKRLVETASNMTGVGRRLLDSKLQETGDQLGRLERRLWDVQRKLAQLNQAKLEVSWVEGCLRTFDKVWDTLTPENRGRLVRAVISRVEVNEPENQVKAYVTNLATGIDALVEGAEAA
ncbi:MAG: recombinase zinc beta ribbon domain-containing protein [Myxococcales bacterium]